MKRQPHTRDLVFRSSRGLAQPWVRVPAAWRNGPLPAEWPDDWCFLTWEDAICAGRK